MEIDSELREILLREARTRVRAMQDVLDAGMDEWDLFSQAHSLSGIAGSLGQEEMEALARDIASRVHDPAGRRIALEPSSATVVREEVERLQRLVERLDQA